MRTTLDPKLDIVFKLLFTDAQNRALLIDLLTAIIRPRVPIEAVDILNPVLRKDGVNQRGAIIDLLLRLSGGERVHVEMQLQNRGGFLSRSLYYWARAYAGQLDAGHPYTELAPTIGIFILDYVALPQCQFHSVYQVLNTVDGSRLSDALELHFLELPKFPRELTEGVEADPVLRWGRFFSAATDEELERLAMIDPILERAKLALDHLSNDPVAREEAFKREIELGDLEYHRQREIAEARAEGQAAGLRQAIEQTCRVLGLELSPERREALHSATTEKLTTLHHRILLDRAWPE